MKFRNIILFAILLFILNLIYFYSTKLSKRIPASSNELIDRAQNNSVVFEIKNTDDILENTKKIKALLLQGFSFTDIDKTSEHQSQYTLNFSKLPQFETPEGSLSLCEKLPFIEIQFSARGQVNNGEIPKLIFLKKCTLNSKKDLSIEVNFYDAKNLFSSTNSNPSANYLTASSSIYFKNLGETFPDDWVLTNVLFYNQKLEQIAISSYELILYLGNPVSVQLH